MSNKKDHQLTAKEAAQKLGKSVTTVHRYVRKGKLSGKYVDTEHGKEVRLKEKEVEKLAEKLSEDYEKLTERAKLFSSEDEDDLDTLKLLERYERTLYQLGQLTERLERQKEKRREKITRLEEEKSKLQKHLQDKAALVEALKSELTRPLTFKERLKGKRITNH